MANSKRSGKGHEGRYALYKQQNRIQVNRRKRLQRALKRNPENKQIEIALSGALGQRRKTPKNEVWSHSDIRVAQLVKSVQGKFNVHMISHNEKISGPARMDHGNLAREYPVKGGRLEVRRAPQLDQRSMFTLGARI